MMTIDRNDLGLLAKSDIEITFSNIASLLTSSIRLIEGEILPNFEAIAAQNEIGFTQKRKDLESVRALMYGQDGVITSLTIVAETVQNMSAISEAIVFDTNSSFTIPQKPLPEGSLLRDTIRRLFYVQKVVAAVSEWINQIGEHDDLKRSALFTKALIDLTLAFKKIVTGLKQSAIVIGKYRDMGDLQVIREMTLNAEVSIVKFNEAALQINRTRKSIPIIERTVGVSRVAPRVVKQTLSIFFGLLIVGCLSYGVIVLHTYAPDDNEVRFEPRESRQFGTSISERQSISRSIQSPINENGNETPIHRGEIESIQKSDEIIATNPLFEPSAIDGNSRQEQQKESKKIDTENQTKIGSNEVKQSDATVAVQLNDQKLLNESPLTQKGSVISNESIRNGMTTNFQNDNSKKNETLQKPQVKEHQSEISNGKVSASTDPSPNPAIALPKKARGSTQSSVLEQQKKSPSRRKTIVIED